MANNTVEAVIDELEAILAPLAAIQNSPRQAAGLLRLLGFEPPPGAQEIGLAALDISDLVERARAIAQASAETLDDELAAARLYADLAIAIANVIRRIIEIANALPNALPANYLAATNIVAELVPRLLNYLIILDFERRQRLASSVLHLMGVFESRLVPADPAAFRATHVRRRIHWDRIAKIFEDPGALARDVYGWGTPAFDPWLLLTRISELLNALSGASRIRQLPASVETRFTGVGPPANAPPLPQLIVGQRSYTVNGTREVGGSFHALRATLPDGSNAGIGFFPWARSENRFEIPLPTGDGLLTFLIETALAIEGGIHVLVFPGRQVLVESDLLRSQSAAVQTGRIGFGLRLEVPEGERFDLLSIPGSVTVGLGGATVLVGAERGASSGIDGFFELSLERGLIAINASESDSFLSSLIPFEAIETEFDLVIGYAPEQGVYFRGAAALEVQIGLHTDLGPFRLELLHIVLGVAAEGLQLEASITGGGVLGPIAVAVERLGVRLMLDFQMGNLGPLDLGFGFKPPTGLGLAIDAGPISGGGFISLDPETGRYAGILQLSIYSVSVTAIGLLDTRDSNGQPLPAPGFSFLIIISAEFPPIQLGYGFTLNGVGGLAGIHRTVVTEALQSGIRTGSVDHILFPEDPIRQAPQIISDLRTIFPPQANRFVFGPMALLGWGSPTLIELELGIILEVPAPIRLILLGQLNLVLPDADAAVVELHIDILGILDFGRRLISIDATLRDSRVAAFTISGDMALRLSWGEKANFAASVGGLNPHFQPPPDFPTLRRAMISFGFEDNPRISVQTYMAVTSNSVQFGARAELYYEAGGFNIHGWLIFDALVILRPFFFRFDFSQGFALRRGDDELLALHVTGTLTGPRPYHIWGEGCISILFWDICIGFDVQFGDRQTVELPEQEIWPLLAEAIADVRNWSAALPPDVYAAVSLRPPLATEVPILVHPMGSATLRQRVVPLNRMLDKYGEFRISGASRFDIDSVAVGDEPAASWTTVNDLFAPGQFEDLSDSDKLSRDSFEQMVAGVSLASRRIEHGAAQSRTLEYETLIVDSPWNSRPAPSYRISLDEQLARSDRGAKAKSLLARSGTSKYASSVGSAPPFTLDDDEYVITNTADLSVQPEFGNAQSKGELYRRLRDHVAAHPEDGERFQVAALSEPGVTT